MKGAWVRRAAVALLLEFDGATFVYALLAVIAFLIGAGLLGGLFLILALVTAVMRVI